MIAAVVLAAGSGRRMGGPKALLRLGEETLLQRAIRQARDAGCAPILAVVGSWDPGPLAAQAVVNGDPGSGMAGSIRLGIAALPPEVEAVLLLAVDQPGVPAEHLRRLRARYLASPGRPVASAYADTLGIPAILPRRLFPALGALQGDRGAKTLLLAEAADVLPCPEGAMDLDTPEDLARFRR